MYEIFRFIGIAAVMLFQTYVLTILVLKYFKYKSLLQRITSDSFMYEISCWGYGTLGTTALLIDLSDKTCASTVLLILISIVISIFLVLRSVYNFLYKLHNRIEER